MAPAPGIRSLYTVALLEGEGVGTAYEYFVKWKRLERFLRGRRPRRILVAGLPEKYGLSMDFLLLAESMDAEVLVVDERAPRLERAEKTAALLKERGLFPRLRLRFGLQAGDILCLRDLEVGGARFDLALSCEVYQRLGPGGREYLARLGEQARDLALFAPNRGNASHAGRSGLGTVALEEFQEVLASACPGHPVQEAGFLDLPPFPPGMSRSQEGRDRAAESRIQGLLMKGLEIYAGVEEWFPPPLKRRLAHIVYVTARQE